MNAAGVFLLISAGFFFVLLHVRVQGVDVEAPAGHDQTENIQHKDGEGRQERPLLQRGPLHDVLDEPALAHHRHWHWVRHFFTAVLLSGLCGISQLKKNLLYELLRNIL